jgi:predicted glycoside hydrolase/deacetylase ChbG (UPF0249 family)
MIPKFASSDAAQVGELRNQDTRRIWLCADDYGMSPAVNAAIRDLIGHGRINATSVMVVAPSFQRTETTALIEANAEGRAAIGLHLTLTAPYRPLTQSFRPLKDGVFPPLATMARRAMLHSLRPKRLGREIASQFAAFTAAFGRAPDFIDGHQHIHLFPQIRRMLLRIAKEAAPGAWVRQCGRTTALSRRLIPGKAMFLDALSKKFRRVAQRYRVRTNAAFAGAYTFRASADYARLFPRFLDGMPDGGVIMCHPGMIDAELRRLDPLTDLREREYYFFSDEEFPKLLAARGFELAAPERT